jgi:hypothetical protein
MRRLALPVLVAVLLPVGAWAAGNPHAEKMHPTKPGKKLATRAVLRGSDLGPDWTQLPAPPDNSNFTCPGFDPDLSAYTVNGKATSLYVQNALSQIGSSADVYASHAQAVGDFKAGAKPQLASCLSAVTNDAFRKNKVNAHVVSSRMVQAPRLGERSAAYHMVSRVRAGGISMSAYSDLLVIQRGRTIAVLVFTGIDTPIPSQAFYGRIVAARMR